MNAQQSEGVIDAVSSYTMAGGSKTGSNFQDAILEPSKAKWSTEASKGLKVIPTVVSRSKIYNFIMKNQSIF